MFSLLERSALAILLLSPAVFAVTVERRQSPGVPMSLPGNWTFEGCFTDDSVHRTLLAATYTDPVSMTVESCIAFCGASGYIYAGVEYGEQCWCDSTIQIPGTQTSISACDQPCTGNAAESCGAGLHLNLYYSGGQGPSIVQAVPGNSLTNWEYIGCFPDNTTNRLLRVRYALPSVTAETCATNCLVIGWNFAGLEFGGECWCANSVNFPTVTQAPNSDCSYVCASDKLEYCGGASLFSYTSQTPSSVVRSSTLRKAPKIKTFVPEAIVSRLEFVTSIAETEHVSIFIPTE